jgi:hypothetical protein
VSAVPLQSRTATAVDIPLRYLVTAAAALIGAAGGLAWLGPVLAGHYYQPRVLALTHTVTLGWIMLAAMGASYQIVPIVLGRPVWSGRLARWQFWALVTGVSGMVAHFAIGTWPGLAMSAALVGAGIALHLLNLAMTARGFRVWRASAGLMALAHAGLALTAVFGLVLAASHVVGRVPERFFATLHAHVHLALLGWVAPMVLGVTARLYPMFFLAPDTDDALAWLQLWGLAVGAPSVVAGLLLDSVLVQAGALACALAIAAHLWWLVRLVRASRRPRLDAGLRTVLIGAAFLVPAAALGLAEAFDVVSGPRMALAYAVLVLGGWVSITIAGMLLKVVPFLVWLRVYSERAGRAPVPTVAELSWAPAERSACALLAAGMLALAAATAAGHGIAIRVAGCMLLAGADALGIALARVLDHLRQPRVREAGRPCAAAGAAGRP